MTPRSLYWRRIAHTPLYALILLAPGLLALGCSDDKASAKPGSQAEPRAGNGDMTSTGASTGERDAGDEGPAEAGGHAGAGGSTDTTGPGADSDGGTADESGAGGSAGKTGAKAGSGAAGNSGLRDLTIAMTGMADDVNQMLEF